MSQEFAAAKLELGQANALVEILGGMDVVHRILSGMSRAVIETFKRLVKTGTIDVPDTEEMVLTEKFLRENYNFGWFGDNFQKLFFGKTEKGANGHKLAIHRLQEPATGQQLKDELGAGAVTPLAYLLFMVKKQKNREEGVLLTNGYANIVIVEVEEDDGKGGKKNALWLVYAYWSSGDRCWRADASPVSPPTAWGAGCRVFSSDS